MTCSLAMVYRIFFPGECKSWNAEWNGIWNGIWNDKLSNKKRAADGALYFFSVV